MPTWSEIPWETVIKVMTPLIALYAAALSTFNFFRAGPKLRFTVRPGMVLAPMK